MFECRLPRGSKYNYASWPKYTSPLSQSSSILWLCSLSMCIRKHWWNNIWNTFTGTVRQRQTHWTLFCWTAQILSGALRNSAQRRVRPGLGTFTDKRGPADLRKWELRHCGSSQSRYSCRRVPPPTGVLPNGMILKIIVVIIIIMIVSIVKRDSFTEDFIWILFNDHKIIFFGLENIIVKFSSVTFRHYLLSLRCICISNWNNLYLTEDPT